MLKEGPLADLGGGSPTSTSGELFAGWGSMTVPSLQGTIPEARCAWLGTNLHFTLDLHRDVERKLNHADRRTGMGATLRAV